MGERLACNQKAAGSLPVRSTRLKSVRRSHMRALLSRRTIVGLVAQLGERIVRNDEAAGSIPAGSTIGFG